MLHVIRRTGDRVTAALPEEVDLQSAPALRAVGDRIIDEGCRHLTLDATRTLHLDSTGITVLLTWYRRLHALGGSLALTGADGRLCSLLARLGLHTVMAITPRPATDAAPGTGPVHTSE